MSQDKYKIYVGERRDSFSQFSYSDRYLDALSSIFNITRSPCAAFVEGEEAGKYYLAYNVNFKSLANKSGAKNVSLNIIPSLIENLNTGNTDLLLAQYLIFTNNAREIMIAILKEESMRSPGESDLYCKIHELRDKCTQLKALLIKYRYSPIKILLSSDESFAKIAAIDEKISKLKGALKESSKDQRKSIGDEISLLRSEKESYNESPLDLSTKVSDYIKNNNIEEALCAIKSDKLVMSDKEKEYLITKLESLIHYDKLLNDTASEYRDIVYNASTNPENKVKLADHTSALHHLLRPIQDTEKLTKFFQLNGIKISDIEIVWPDNVQENYTKHCEEILHEKFPKAKYIGISHLSCASCSKLLPDEKHRGDSAVAFPLTSYFEDLIKTPDSKEIRDDDGVIVNPMQRTISYDEGLNSLMGSDDTLIPVEVVS